jgi:tRNA(Ile2) C34 agmatinyltransferase TiaS
MLSGRLAKAERGELAIPLPISGGRVVLRWIPTTRQLRLTAYDGWAGDREVSRGLASGAHCRAVGTGSD